jgi:hypothetical protein
LSEATPSTERSHTAIAERLGPWLALANLVVPTTREIASPTQAPLDAMKSILRRARQSQGVPLSIPYAMYAIEGGERWAREFYEFFHAVRSVLNQLVARREHPESYQYWELKALSALDRAAGVTIPEDSENEVLRPVDILPLGGPLTEQIHVQKGLLEFRSSILLENLRRALTGVELARLRRCPVCTGFYYALRANKGACDKHVGLARIWKIRQKSPEYRERWRNKRLEPFIDQSRPSDMTPSRRGD